MFSGSHTVYRQAADPGPYARPSPYFRLRDPAAALGTLANPGKPAWGKAGRIGQVIPSTILVANPFSHLAVSSSGARSTLLM